MTDDRPDRPEPWSGGFAFVFAGLTVAHLLILASARLYPFVDLPFHLAAATIVRFVDDPATSLAAFYAVDLFPKPNVLHVWFSSLSALGDVETANRVWIAAYVLTLPLATLLLVRRVGGSPWISLLAFLTLYNFNLAWGFMGYVLALPLFLFFLLALLRYDDRPGGARAAWLALIGLLLFATHLILALFAVLVVLALIASRPRRGFRDKALVSLSCLPVALATLAWWWVDHAGETGDTLAYLVSYYAGGYLASLADRIKFYHLDNRQLFAGLAGYAAAFLLYGGTLALVAAGLVRDRGRALKQMWLSSRPVLLCAACAVGCYALLPSTLPGQWYLFERFLVLVVLCAILVGARALAGRVGRALVAAVVGVCVLHAAVYAHYFLDFRRHSADFTAGLLADIEAEEVVAGIIREPWFRGHPVYVHFPSYHVVWNRGIAVTTVADYRFSVIGKPGPGDGLPRYNPWTGYNLHYDGRYDECEWILARGELPESARELGERLETVEVSTPGAPSWTLYRNPQAD